MSNLIPMMFAVASAAALIVGALIYFVGKEKTQNAIWFVYNILFSLWCFCIYEALFSTDPAVVIYWFRTSLAALIFIVPVFLHFLSLYSDREIFKNKILGKVYITAFLFFISGFIIPNEFVKGIESGLHLESTIIPGLGFGIFSLVFVLFTIVGFYYLLHTSKLYLRFKRNQRMWLFLAMFLSVMTPFSFILTTYKVIIFPFGLFFVTPYLILGAYTLLKYHVAEMDIVTNKTVIFAYFTVSILFIYAGIVYVLHRVVGVEYFISSIISGGVVLMNLLFVAQYSGMLKLNKVAKSIVYEKKLAYYKFLENFNSFVDKTADLTDLASYILDSLTEIVGVENAALYLYNEDNRNFKLIGNSGTGREEKHSQNQVPLDDPFVKFLKKGNVYVANEEKDFAEDYDLAKIKESFKAINASLVIPLHYSLPLYHVSDMVGFLNLGTKKDKQKYTKEDIDILNAFGRQLSISIDKANLYSKAIEDDLTKLYRVNYFNKKIEEEIEKANRYDTVFSLILFDIDDFKKINDTYGHQAGDKVLKKISDIMRAFIRKADIPARCGGEEFSILLPETNKKSALIAAERLRQNIEEGFKNDKKPSNVTISVGVAEYSSGIKRYQLIREADQAMYKAKRAGKNQVC